METTFTSGKVLSRDATPDQPGLVWSSETLDFSEDAVSSALLRLQDELYVVRAVGRWGSRVLARSVLAGLPTRQPGVWTDLLAILPPLPIETAG